MSDVDVYERDKIPPNGLNVTLSTVQFGGRARLQIGRNITVFAQELEGAGLATGSLYSHSKGIGAAHNGFGRAGVITVGGGIGWRLSEHVRIRVVQMDNVHSRFADATNDTKRQSSLRLSTGIVFDFHSRGRN